MVEKNPILVISESGTPETYQNLPIDEEIVVVPPSRALCALLGLKVDLILLDCDINNELGIKLLKEVKPRFPELPIIFITGKSSEELVIEAFRCGARDYHRKPLDPGNFGETATNLLQVKRTSREKRLFMSLSPKFHQERVRSAETKNIPEYIQRAVQYIEDNIDQAINLDTLAQRANMSKYHFSRAFKSFTGMSPVRFVKYMKVQRAKSMLREGSRNIGNTAAKMGFSDVGSFIRCFKTFEGVTPSTYRSMQRDR